MSRVHPINDSLSSKVKSIRAYIASKPSIQVNKIASSCEICSGPYDTQYCMENPEQAFVDYASSHNNKVGDLSVTKQILKGCCLILTLLKKLDCLGSDPDQAATRRDGETLSNKGIFKNPSILFSRKYKAQSALGKEDRNLGFLR
ncbi:hypothetical protein Tco_0997512 [Tanacetum coccineum]